MRWRKQHSSQYVHEEGRSSYHGTDHTDYDHHDDWLDNRLDKHVEHDNVRGEHGHYHWRTRLLRFVHGHRVQTILVSTDRETREEPSRNEISALFENWYIQSHVSCSFYYLLLMFLH